MSWLKNEIWDLRKNARCVFRLCVVRSAQEHLFYALRTTNYASIA